MTQSVVVCHAANERNFMALKPARNSTKSSLFQIFSHNQLDTRLPDDTSIRYRLRSALMIACRYAEKLRSQFLENPEYGGFLTTSLAYLNHEGRFHTSHLSEVKSFLTMDARQERMLESMDI